MQTATQKPNTVKNPTMWLIFNDEGQNRIFSTRKSAEEFRNSSDGWTYPSRYTTSSIKRAV